MWDRLHDLCLTNLLPLVSRMVVQLNTPSRSRTTSRRSASHPEMLYSPFPLYSSHMGIVIIGPDGVAYIPVFGGFVTIRDLPD